MTIARLIDNEGELSNCFSINQLVGQNIILKKQTETLSKYDFSAMFNFQFDSSRYYSDLSPIGSEYLSQSARQGL